MTDAKTLARFKYAEPFKPFEIVLDDGRTVRVEDPWTVGWSEEAKLVMFPGGVDWTDWTDFSHVIEVRPAAKRRRRRKAS
jgi:hypothetical protein